jgi:hypothetical protein
MKALLRFSAFAFLLLAAANRCLALMEIEDVTKERAKSLGVTVQSRSAGTNQINVTVEFKAKGELKDFSRVELEIYDGNRLVIWAPLLPDRTDKERIVAHFNLDRATVVKTIITIVTDDGGLGRAGYQFNLKNFIEPEKNP